MADVSDNRGQLLLITALGLAILLVSLSLVVNTAIYTENLATRSSNVAGGSQSIQYQESVEKGLTDLIVYVNFHDNVSFDALYRNFTTGVNVWSDTTGKHQARSGVAVNLSLADTRNGTRIEQTDPARNFSNASLASTDWTVVSNVEATRRFRMNVSDTELNSTGDSPFRIVVDDGSESWEVNISKDAGDIAVGIDGPTNDTCRVSASRARINLTAGTINGIECEPLVFGEGLSGPYRIRFENVSNVDGTYTLIVTNTSLADNPDPHLNPSGGGSPFATHAIYDAKIRFVYQSPRIFIDRTVRIVPGDTDG